MYAYQELECESMGDFDARPMYGEFLGISPLSVYRGRDIRRKGQVE